MKRLPCAWCGNSFTPEYEEQVYCQRPCARTAIEARRLRRGGPTFDPARPMTVPQLVAVLNHFTAALDGFAAELETDVARAQSRGLVHLVHDLASMRDRVRDVSQDVGNVIEHLAAKPAARVGTERGGK